jgi:N-acetylglucosamine kinase-like BadF-type ATPase
VPEELAQEFAQTFPASYPEIVRQVYRTPAPARYLGSLAPFVVAHYKTNAYAKELVDKNFRAFFERTVQQYDALPLGIVGGFGFACRDILQELAAEYGFTLSRIIASPLEGLKLYHGL